MFWEFRNGIIVKETELDCDLHKFDVYDDDVLLGTVYPVSLEDMHKCIDELDKGNDPISAKWEDGCGNLCTRDGWSSVDIEKLLCHGEELFYYGHTGSYCRYCCIKPKDSTDLAATLEDTLHRILSCGNARDVQEILGAKVPTEEEWKALEEYDEYVNIDLGYVIPGLLVKA